MHPQIEEIFDDAENRYLKGEELRLVAQYVSSIPERLAAYRNLRDSELEIMQWVARQLEAEMPSEQTEVLERSLRNALLMLRHCGMAMVLNEESIIRDRFLNWVGPIVEVYNTQAVDARLYQLLNHRLAQTLGSHMSWLSPMLTIAQTALLSPRAEVADVGAFGIGA